MKHKILLLLFLFSLLPSWGWGQIQKKETIKLDELLGSYEINDPGEYTFTGEYKGTPNFDTNGDTKLVINVAAGLDVTIILNDATIDLSVSGGCPLSAKDAKTVNLQLKGINTLIADGSNYGIWAPEKTGCGIIIDEDTENHGSLIVKATVSSGIGGHYSYGKNGYITITGGTVTATSSSSAGIGGNYQSTSGKITITGGTVIATSTSGAGIGSGQAGYGCDITITGGIVTATSNAGAGIGDGKGSSGSTFSTGENGTAFINASSISDDSYISNQTTSGIIFDNNKTGKFYGSSVTLSDNVTLASDQSLTISDGQTLTIAKGVTLTIAQGATLTNKGTIKCDGEINGTIGGDKKVQYAITCNLNYDNPPKEYIEYVANGESVLDGKRDYYEFLGWYTESDGGVKVTTITEATIVYAHWKPIDLKAKVPMDIFNSIYGISFKSPINAEMFIDNKENVGGLKSIVLKSTINDKFKDLHIEYSDNKGNLEGNLIGIPIGIPNEHPSTISFTITANNGATATAEMLYTVRKADLEIISGESITKVYDGNNTVTTPNALKLVGVYSDDDVYLNPYTLTYDDVNAGTKKKITLSGKYTLAGEKKDCYNLIIPPGFALTGSITPAPLTITPKPDQKLFEDETPAYEVIGAVMGEDPILTGSLAIQNGKVVINDLQLEAPFSDNYSLSLTPDIPITIINNETVKSLVQFSGTTNANGAYIDEVTVTAPDGFEIALVRSSLKSPLIYTKSFMWNQKGTSILNYMLKRISDGEESNEFSMEITVVESQDITDPDDDDDNDYDDNYEPPITEYNVEIPEVEGISVDEGFGDHWIKDWKDFSFIITVKEGYVENSDPEVTIKGYDFEFDALTDTTYECRIDHVYKNAEVIITGIVKDPPATANTAIKAPEESWKIMNGVAYITVAKPTIFKVVEINGNITIYNLSPGVTPIYNLPKANVLLFSFDGKKAEKVIISNR